MTLKKMFWAIVVLLLIVSASISIAAAGHYLKVRQGYAEFLAGAGTSQRIPLTAAPLNPSWIISGDPTCSALQFASAFDQSSGSGMWQCEGPAKFEFHYQSEETVYILEGSAEVEYLGNTLTLEPGSSTSFAFGTKAIWTVPERVRKTWWIHSEPGFAAKLARRFQRISSD